MFCPNCGADIPDSSSFCEKCGAKLEQAAEAGQSEAKPAEPGPEAPKVTIPQATGGDTSAMAALAQRLSAMGQKSEPEKTEDATPDAEEDDCVFLTEDQIMDIFLKFEEDQALVVQKRIGIFFPTISGRAHEIDFYDRLVKAAKSEVFQTCLNRFIKLAKKNDSFSFVLERTDSEYCQTRSGGLALVHFKKLGDNEEITEFLEALDMQCSFMLSFMNLPKEEADDDQLFIEAGKEMQRCLVDRGFSDCWCIITEIVDGEEIAICES